MVKRRPQTLEQWSLPPRFSTEHVYGAWPRNKSELRKISFFYSKFAVFSTFVWCTKSVISKCEFFTRCKLEKSMFVFHEDLLSSLTRGSIFEISQIITSFTSNRFRSCILTMRRIENANSHSKWVVGKRQQLDNCLLSLLPIRFFHS